MADGLKNLFERFKKKEEELVNEKDPIPIHTPKAPAHKESVGSLYPARIKFRGLYDLDGLYKFMANWLRQRRFKVYENLYKSKPPELQINITAEREKSGFVMEVITIYYHSYGDYDIDTVVNGKIALLNANFKELEEYAENHQVNNLTFLK